MLEHAPPPAFAVAMYRFLARDRTVFVVLRRPGLPRGTTIADMAADQAVMIREAFGVPVDVVGTSTGGTIALQLAADHPDTVRRLVVHASAHELSAEGKRWQLELARLGAGRLLARGVGPADGDRAAHAWRGTHRDAPAGVGVRAAAGARGPERPG
jgi:pimeloyl-ACP methyl ester carboxylesterase